MSQKSKYKKGTTQIPKENIGETYNLEKDFFFRGTGVWTQGLTLAKQTSTIWATPLSCFCSGYLGDYLSLWTISLDRPGIVILLILASQAARIIGMGHQHLV
jgi:hypothetical protein